MGLTVLIFLYKICRFNQFEQDPVIYCTYLQEHYSTAKPLKLKQTQEQIPCTGMNVKAEEH